MIRPEPIYLERNCQPAYQLNWSLSIFWKSIPVNEQSWLKPLSDAKEPDGVRVLEHRQPNASTSQFLLSSSPQVAPCQIIRSVKGRLQYLVRNQLPKAFHRNYSLVSIGTANCEVVENYVASQLDHHPLADARFVERFLRYQINDPTIDLNHVRRTNYGEYIYNLHLVFEYETGRREFQDEILLRMRDMVDGSSRAKEWLLSRAGIVPDHLHLAVGCGIADAPQQVALSYLNNLADVHGMMPVFKFGYYAGTFGPYDLGAIWSKQGCDAAP